MLLVMRGDMADLCEEHLQPNDFIYVAGRLGSYTKKDKDEKDRVCYKVRISIDVANDIFAIVISFSHLIFGYIIYQS